MLPRRLLEAVCEMISAKYSPKTIEDAFVRVSFYTGERYAPVLFRSDEFKNDEGLFDVVVRIGEGGFKITLFRPECGEYVFVEETEYPSWAVDEITAEIAQKLEKLKTVIEDIESGRFDGMADLNGTSSFDLSRVV